MQDRFSATVWLHDSNIKEGWSSKKGTLSADQKGLTLFLNEDTSTTIATKTENTTLNPPINIEMPNTDIKEVVFYPGYCWCFDSTGKHSIYFYDPGLDKYNAYLNAFGQLFSSKKYNAQTELGLFNFLQKQGVTVKDKTHTHKKTLIILVLATVLIAAAIVIIDKKLNINLTNRNS